MEIASLEWYEHSRAKLAAHGISRREVRDLVRRGTYTVGVHPDYPDQVRITGPTSTGRFLTIAPEDLGGGAYRPITGWEATAAEVRRYYQDTEGAR